MKGKEFGTMQKVKLHISLAIVHGRLVLFTISSADTKKDPNSSIELVCAALSLLKRQGQHLPSTTLFLQHDNCCREFKKKFQPSLGSQPGEQQKLRCNSLLIPARRTHP